ncbi:MAG: hypothetical protein IJU56_01575, partial [Clostridia bacterium]|nr:hypothetical protein [Clostridia bacterium]
QVLLPLPKRKKRLRGAFFFFTGKITVPEARACRASPPKRRRWRMQRGGDGAAVEIARRSKAQAISGTARGQASPSAHTK